MSDEQERSPQEIAQQLHHIAQNALKEKGIPNFYMNGFISGVGLGDAYLLLQTNGKTTAVVNMTLSTPKTLANNLITTIQGIEGKLEQETLTLQQFQEKITE